MKLGKYKLAKGHQITFVDVLHVLAAAAIGGIGYWTQTHHGADITVGGLSIGAILVTALAAFNKDNGSNSQGADPPATQTIPPPAPAASAPPPAA